MDKNDFYTGIYNPDVLSCLANLSNDEVFTPPEIANQMLDILPQELFSDPNTKFLDPACKSGVFLREIAKRLLTGLETKIPDLQQRIDHIFKNQLYGIAITELTSLLSRRGVYCSKYPNSKYSVTEFDNAEGNVRYKKIQHKWQNGKCVFCGASQKSNLGDAERGQTLESHAYELIHTTKPEEIFNMKFDVIIGNPPYQLSTAQDSAQAVPIYQKFVMQAKKMNPRYISMIIPSRWMVGGMRLDDFREETLNDRSMKILHDFENATDCFNGVEIKGGVCYFLWDRENNDDCEVYEHREKVVTFSKRPLLEDNIDVFIRKNEMISIYKKVQEYKEVPFSSICSPMKPFGFGTAFKDFVSDGEIEIFANQKRNFVLKSQITKNVEWVSKYKLFIPKAVGSGNVKYDIIKPIIAGQNTCCTETYIVVGPFNNEELAKNVKSYTQTRFFHILLSLKKITQDTLQKTYSCIPMQDFSKPWTDEELYAKYGLTDEEIDFIESSVWPDKKIEGGDDSGK